MQKNTSQVNWTVSKLKSCQLSELTEEIMPAVEILYNIMQCTDLTVQKVKQHLETFQAAVNSIRNSSSTENVKKSLSSSAKEVCDSVSFNINERVMFSG